MNRRRFLLTTAGATAPLLVPALPFGLSAAVAQGNLPMDVRPTDRTLGDPEAPIVVIEYASFTCPHCASVHVNTWPSIRDSYVADGHVLWVFREFARNQPDLAAGIMARCVADDQFFAMVETLFHQQANWAAYDVQQTAYNLSRLGLMSGVSEDDYRACLQNQDFANEIVDMRVEANDLYSIQATPTFIVNGEKVEGARDFPFFQQMFDRLLTS